MVLKIQNLCLHYQTLRGDVKAVDRVSFDIESGQALGLVGESGCGKTSMSLGIARLLPKNVSQYTGSIQLEGKELMSMTNDEFRSNINWKKISMVFQGAMNSLNPVLKVGMQVAEPLKIHLNMKENDANYRNIFISNFKENTITKKLQTIAMYTAGSISSDNYGIAFCDENTFSSLVETSSNLSPIAKRSNVLGIYDLTFFTEPYRGILDNNQLISNIADWLAYRTSD